MNLYPGQMRSIVNLLEALDGASKQDDVDRIKPEEQVYLLGLKVTNSDSEDLGYISDEIGGAHSWWSEMPGGVE